MVFKSGAPHQSKAPSSEYRVRMEFGFENEGRSNRVIGEAPYQSQVTSSDFRVLLEFWCKKPGAPHPG